MLNNMCSGADSCRRRTVGGWPGLERRERLWMGGWMMKVRQCWWTREVDEGGGRGLESCKVCDADDVIVDVKSLL